MHPPAGLEQNHVSGLGGSLQSRRHFHGIVKGPSHGLGHTAGDGAVQHPSGVRAVGKDHVRLFRRDPADFIVLGLGAVPQLQHFAQHRQVPSGPVAQHIQRRRHGLRAGVVAVVDDGTALGLENLLTTGHVLELIQRLANVLRCDPQLQSHGHCRQRVGNVMLSFQLHFHREGQPPGLHPEAQNTVRLADIQRPDVAALAAPEIGDALLGGHIQTAQQGVVAVEQQHSLRGHAL